MVCDLWSAYWECLAWWPRKAGIVEMQVSSKPSWWPSSTRNANCTVTESGLSSGNVFMRLSSACGTQGGHKAVIKKHIIIYEVDKILNYQSILNYILHVIFKVQAYIYRKVCERWSFARLPCECIRDCSGWKKQWLLLDVTAISGS